MENEMHLRKRKRCDKAWRVEGCSGLCYLTTCRYRKADSQSAWLSSFVCHHRCAACATAVDSSCGRGSQERDAPVFHLRVDLTLAI